jgi:hypothetical protein
MSSTCWKAAYSRSRALASATRAVLAFNIRSSRMNSGSGTSRGLRCVAVWILGVGLLCSSSTHARAVPAPHASHVRAETALTVLYHGAELGVVRSPAQVSATPVRLPVPGVPRIPGCVEPWRGWRQPQGLVRTQHVDLRPLAQLVTRRLRLPRANTTGDPDG